MSSLPGKIIELATDEAPPSRTRCKVWDTTFFSVVPEKKKYGKNNLR
jgi:hypothetical protein